MSDDRRKRVFSIATGVSLAVLLPGTVIGFEWARRALGVAWADVGVSLLMVLMLPVVLSYMLGGYVCRRMGLPLTHRKTERLVRGRQRTGVGERSRLQCTMPAAFFVVMVALQVTSAVGTLLERSHLNPLWGWLMMALSIALTVGLFGCILGAASTLDADDEGVTHGFSLFGIRRRKAVTWDSIASCSIDTTRDALDGSGGVTCTFRDAEGRVLLRARLPSESDEECARFLARIREQGLQTTPVELIAAEAPGGTGTEPEAASTPQGTGTEVEAALATVDVPDRQAGRTERPREVAR